MKPYIKSLIGILFFGALCGTAFAKLNVIATTPDFGALAKEIGGDKVDVFVLAKATEDPHFVDAKP
ncbi:MAG TPA: zinc ABC transporter substrate-binding protein, partial [Candidatus Eisenbacteria bacterium]|nr:zinc ABC transporter substrate-binding protein [Candidatus Eisenbacteria bacterium]